MSRTTPSRPHRTGRPALAVALTLVAVLALGLGGCQTPDEAGDATPTPTPTPSTAPVAVDLTVSVDATGAGAVTRHTLTCVPTGGDHPDAEAACAAIAAAGGAAAFDPPPTGTVCTEQWGGPQVATVDGTVGGSVVHARFDRHDGCAISRWDRLAALFGPDAGLL